jgi:predicted ATP-grasp superfamily ATP-dependent carboligase
VTHGLIPDYPGQQTISGLRSLHREGDSADLAWDIRPGSISQRLACGRYISNFHRIPHAVAEDAYFAGVQELLGTGNFDYLIPFGLDSYHALARQKDRLTVPSLIPTYSQFETANDKEAMTRLCAEVGVRVPRTAIVSDIAALESEAEALGFPVVIRARAGTGVERTFRVANDLSQLERYFVELRDTEFEGGAYRAEPFLQEYIPGKIHDVCLVAKEGELLAALTQQRSVMYPISGGPGAVNITTEEPELVAAAERIVQRLDWTGPAQIEFKRKPDGSYYFIEMNPKLWGTLDLSIKAGLSFPWLIRQVCLGEEYPTPRYRVGVKYKFRFPQSSFAELQQARHRHKVSSSAGRRTYSDFDWRDPAPDARRAVGTLVYALSGHVKPASREVLHLEESVELPSLAPQHQS